MVARTNRTSAVVLPAEQWETLKRVALIRTLTGKTTKASVSEVLRDLVEAAMPALRQEIASHEKGSSK